MRNFGVIAGQPVATDKEMPTGAEWRAAGQQMGALTAAGPITRLRSRLTHWWKTRQGLKLQRERAALGLFDLEMVIDGLRADLDASNAEIHARFEVDERNLNELVRQFHVTAQGVQSHANVLNGLMSNPLLQKSVRSHMAAVNRRAARAAARQAQGLVSTEPTEGEEALEAELDDEANDVIPIHPLTSEPGEHPRAD